jgi:hypothetical protein
VIDEGSDVPKPSLHRFTLQTTYLGLSMGDVCPMAQDDCIGPMHIDTTKDTFAADETGILLSVSSA